MKRQSERDYDRIAGSRMAKMKGGIPLHVALSNSKSITIRNKIKRMGLKGSHIDDLISLIDEIGIQETLSHQPLGVRFATIKREKNKPKIWKPGN